MREAFKKSKTVQKNTAANRALRMVEKAASRASLKAVQDQRQAKATAAAKFLGMFSDLNAPLKSTTDAIFNLSLSLSLSLSLLKGLHNQITLNYLCPSKS
jgi:hypothetical protein